MLNGEYFFNEDIKVKHINRAWNSR